MKMGCYNKQPQIRH